jgi:hypothetical protein
MKCSQDYTLIQFKRVLLVIDVLRDLQSKGSPNGGFGQPGNGSVCSVFPNVIAIRLGSGRQHRNQNDAENDNCRDKQLNSRQVMLATH